MTFSDARNLFRSLRRASGASANPDAGGESVGPARLASAQASTVGVESIADGVVHLRGGGRRAVLEVGGIDLDMLAEVGQEAVLAAYASFLNALTFPVQILVRVRPADLEATLRELDRGTRQARSAALAAVGRRHRDFLQQRATGGGLLERRFSVIVPADQQPGDTAGRPAAWRPWPPAARGRPEPVAAAGDGASTQLVERCSEVARQLARCGLVARRLDNTDLARLHYDVLCPEQSRVQRLRGDLADYTTPAVRAAQRIRPAAPASPPAADAGMVGGILDPTPGGREVGTQRADGLRLLGLGGRTPADLIAPAAVEFARDHLRLGQEWARALAVTAYPRTVDPGWLAPLLEFDAPLDLSLHVVPLPTGEMVRALSYKLVQLQSSRLLDDRNGRLTDAEREVAYEDVERLRDALQRGEERVFAVGFYLLVRAPSLARLDDLTRRVESTLDGMMAHSRVTLLEQESGFGSCSPEGLDRLRVHRNLDTSSLATAFPFCGSTLSMERGVFYGVSRRSHTPVIVDPFDPGLENANMAVIATSGAGKSYFTKLMALRNGLLGVDFLVIDPEDEYRRLCTAVEGQYVRLASTSAQRLNPFDLPAPPPESPPERATGSPTGSPDGSPDGAPSTPSGARGQADRAGQADQAGQAPEDEDDPQDVLAEQVTALVALLEIMVATPEAPLGAHERAVLDRALYATYAAAGITRNPTTHERPAPLLRDLYAVLQGAAAGGDATALGLVARLHRYVEGSLAGLFAGPTNVALDRPFVVFNIQRLEPELRPLAIHVITAFVWAQVRHARRPRLLVVDESWSVLQYREGGAFLAGLARRARKYYLGLVTISQSVTDFTGSDAGRAVLANAAVKLLLKQDGATVDRLVELFGLTAEERQFLLAAGKGEGLLCARGSRVALQIEASAAEHELVTTAPAEVAARMLRGGAPPAATGDRLGGVPVPAEGEKRER